MMADVMRDMDEVLRQEGVLIGSFIVRSGRTRARKEVEFLSSGFFPLVGPVMTKRGVIPRLTITELARKSASAQKYDQADL